MNTAEFFNLIKARARSADRHLPGGKRRAQRWATETATATEIVKDLKEKAISEFERGENKMNPNLDWQIVIRDRANTPIEVTGEDTFVINEDGKQIPIDSPSQKGLAAAVSQLNAVFIHNIVAVQLLQYEHNGAKVGFNVLVGYPRQLTGNTSFFMSPALI